MTPEPPESPETPKSQQPPETAQPSQPPESPEAPEIPEAPEASQALAPQADPAAEALKEVNPELAQLAAHLAALRQQVHRVIRGQERVIDHLLITLVCGGHALLEGVPGTAKTLMVRTLARALDCRTKRIQFTPDLMPSDIVGTNVYNLQTQTFDLHRGPVFTDLLLADEINRAPAKTQSALLEGMSERHVTLDATRHELSPVFTVFATQNPIEFEGTYPLPEAQQDRFLLKIKVDYPSLESERAVLLAVDGGHPPEALDHQNIEPVLSVEQLVKIQNQLAGVRIEPSVLDYVLNIVRQTRDHESLLMGAGPRGSIFLLRASKAHALLGGRDFVTPDDVTAMVSPVLGHRVVLSAEAEISGEQTDSVLQSILDQTQVPR